jgi:hypothetical protein
MSFFFGGGGKKVKPQYTGLQMQTASSTQALYIMWGANRVAPNLIWYGDFKSHKKKQKAGKGGGSATTYTYSASVIMALCDGGNDGIHDVRTVYRDNDSNTTYQAMGFSLFKGTMPQAGWGYLHSKHPDQYRTYPGVAYLAIANYDLGSSASLPNHSFEVLARQYKTAKDGSDDANPAVVVDEFLTYSSFGVGFDNSYLDYTSIYSQTGTTTGDASFETYCAAMSFSISPIISDQTAASDILDNWTQVLNTAVVWTGYSVKLIPYDLSNIDGNGYKYRPIQNALVTVDDSWFVSDKEDPVQVERSDPADANNQLTLTLANRDNDYNSAPVDWRDQGLIDQFGLRPASSFDATKIITRTDMATKIVAIMGQRQAYIRNSYQFSLPSQFIIYEPMDLMLLIDKKLGSILVQVTDIEEDDDGDLKFTADEVKASVSSNLVGFAPPTYSGGSQQSGAPPGPVNPPLIFDVPANLSNGTPQVWAAVSGGDGTTANPYWGGCYVYISTDNVTFSAVGELDSPARLGKTTSALSAFAAANPDTSTLSVDMSMSDQSDLMSVSADDAASGITLCYLDGEFLSFQNATLTSANEYDLTPLWRGLYQSPHGAHAVGKPFARLDDSIFKYQLPEEYIGQELYFKFQSFNIWQNATEDLSECVTYTYTPTGLGFEIAPPTSTTLSFALDPTGTTITGTVVVGPSAGPYLDHYDVQETSDGGATWTDVPSISAGSTKTTFSNAMPSTNYKVRTRAVSGSVNGQPSDWVESAVVSTGTISATSKPDSPTAFAGTGGTLSNAMHWTAAAAGAMHQGYKVYEFEGHSSTFSDGVPVGTTDLTSFTRSGLIPSQEYTYWLTAYNTAGESPEVGPIYLTTEAGGGGGGGSVEVDSEGVSVVAVASKLNFTGSGVTVTDGGSGEAIIDITGGGGGGGGGNLLGYAYSDDDVVQPSNTGSALPITGMSINFTAKAGFIKVSWSVLATVASGQKRISVNLDGSNLGNTGDTNYYTIPQNENSWQSSSAFIIEPITAGAHTLELLYNDALAASGVTWTYLAFMVEQVEVGGSGGGGGGSIDDAIALAIAEVSSTNYGAGGATVDVTATVGSSAALAYLLYTTSGSPVSATETFTVPAGKNAVLSRAFYSDNLKNDTGHYQHRLNNLTSGESFNPIGGRWGGAWAGGWMLGDGANDVFSIPYVVGQAGDVLQCSAWTNGDGNSRTVPCIYILTLVDAPVIPATAHPYWKLSGTGLNAANGNQYCCFSEFYIHQTIGGADEIPIASTNTATYGGDGADQLYDGNINTIVAFDSAVTGHVNEAVFQYAAPIYAREIIITGENATSSQRGPTSFDLSYSDDGVTFTVLTTITIGSWTSNAQVKTKKTGAI